jgi:lincosamide nucleotidyltransferase A/C/D/E
VVSAEEAIDIYQRLSAEGIQVWLTGGWGIDALLGEQSRPHKDLDIIMLLDDVARLRELLAGDGYGLKELWEENLWVADRRGVEVATAFVLHDAEGRELDAHALRLGEQGNGVPAWDAEGRVFSRDDLAGQGAIAGFAVRCLSAAAQTSCHTGYELPAAQREDLRRLRDKLGVEYPAGLSGQEMGGSS